MATTATVVTLTGRAWVREPDGSLLELHPGTLIAPDSEVVTAAGATVTLAIDGAAPITIGPDRSVTLTDELASPADPAAASIAPPARTDSERLLAALEAGEDPFGILEAAAAIAGEPGGEDGGGSFVRLLRILEPTTPLALAYPRPARGEEDVPRLNGVAEGSTGGPGDNAAPLPPAPPPPLNNPPVSRNAGNQMTEGRTYLLKTGDFNNPDGKTLTFDDPADSPADGWQAVIIDTLPASGTLKLDGTDILAGQSINKSDIDAGKLTYQAPTVPGDRSLGDNSQYAFTFRVQDDSGGNDTSVNPYTYTLTVDQFISGKNEHNTGAKALTGGAGDDVILGDAGGVHIVPQEGVSYNIALVLDVSTTMNETWGGGSETRLKTAQNALKNLMNELADHTGNVNVTLITFPAFDDAGTTQFDYQGFEFKNLTANDKTSFEATIDALVLHDGGTPYGYAFNQATDWFKDMATNSAYDGYENLTYFLTDGNANHGNNTTPEDDNARDTAFAHLTAISPKVYAIGIGSGVDKDNLDYYDTTNVVETKPGIVDLPGFAHGEDSYGGNAGIHDTSRWSKAGNGSLVKDGSGANARLRIVDNDSSDSPYTVTMHDAHKIYVTDGAHLKFDAITGNWNAADTFTWHLQKWDATANGGLGDWATVQSGTNTGNSIKTAVHGAGDYRFQFEVNDRSPGGGNARVDIGHIQRPIPDRDQTGRPARRADRCQRFHRTPARGR